MPQQAIVGTQNHQPLFFWIQFLLRPVALQKSKSKKHKPKCCFHTNFTKHLDQPKNVAAIEAFQFVSAIQSFATSILLSKYQIYFRKSAILCLWIFNAKAFSHTPERRFACIKNIQKLTNLTSYQRKFRWETSDIRTRSEEWEIRFVWEEIRKRLDSFEKRFVRD